MNRLKTIRLSLLLAGFVSIFGSLQAQEKSSTKTLILNEPNSIKSDAMKGKDKTTEPLVCQLTGPEQASRKAELQKEVFSQVKKIDETQAGYIFYFPYEEDFLIQLTDYVITENSCCPFFTFDLRLQAKNDVMLTISGSSERAKEMIAMTLIQK